MIIQRKHYQKIHLLNVSKSIVLSDDGVIKLDLLRKFILNDKWSKTFDNINDFFNNNFEFLKTLLKLKDKYHFDWLFNYNAILENDIYRGYFVHWFKGGESINNSEVIKSLWLICFKIIGTLANSANHELHFIDKLKKIYSEIDFNFLFGHIIISNKYLFYLKNFEGINKDDECIYLSLEKSKNEYFNISIIKLHDIFDLTNENIKKENLNERNNLFKQIFSKYLLIDNKEQLLDSKNNFISVYGFFLYLSSVTIILEKNSINLIMIIFLRITNVINDDEFKSLSKIVDNLYYANDKKY